jgi:hypothetical protein
MRWIYINVLLSDYADPPVGKSAARENQRYVFVRHIIKDG